jgi:hypothetical protein
MTPEIVEVNPWKSFLHKKIAGKTDRMQRLLFLLVLFSISLSQAATKAAKISPSTEQRPRIVQPPPLAPANDDKTHEASPAVFKGFSVGTTAGYVDYKEPGQMREYGELYGLNAAYDAINETSTIATHFEGQLVAGRLLYDGADVNLITGVRTPKTAPTDDYIFDSRATIGTFRKISSAFTVTPYIGLGYRDLNDKIQGSGSYNRNISYVYVPIGAQVAGSFSDSWSYSVGADIDVVLYGTVISKLSDIDPANPDITNHNHGFGARLTTSIRKKFSRFAIHFTPFYQKWKIEQSDGVAVTINNSAGTLFEPANESDFVGLNAGMDF